jgi:ADP-heptose:LPS heptosyltransferase
MKKIPKNIIISRTDSIGDVVLTLPMAAVLKKHYPEMTIGFMGKAYTKPVIDACKYVDLFIDVEDFMDKKMRLKGEKPECIIHVFPKKQIARRAKDLGIAWRIGTRNRLYHWFTCNKLVKLSRKNSDLHEAQLNLVLLKPLGIEGSYSLDELGQLSGIEKLQPLPGQYRALLKQDRYNLILHPKSQGNGREWPLDNYIKLVRLLDANKFNIFVSGTDKERQRMKQLFQEVGDRVTDLTGKMSLGAFISFINESDGLIASGTGPIHLAASLQKDALGIYPPIRPVHPGRWAPLGSKAQVFVLPNDCNDCKGKALGCHCIKEVPAEWLQQALEQKYQQKMANAQ